MKKIELDGTDYMEMYDEEDFNEDIGMTDEEIRALAIEQYRAVQEAKKAANNFKKDEQLKANAQAKSREVEGYMGTTQMDKAEVIGKAIHNANMEKEMEESRPTIPQLEMISRMCKERGLIMDESRLATKRKASAYITDLIANKSIPVSDGQKELIERYCAQLGMKLPDYSLMEGGRDGTASQFITRLVAVAAKVPTLNQQRLLQKMNICPLCPPVDVKKISKTEASEHINAYSDLFKEWEKTKATVQQRYDIVRLNCIIEDKDTSDITSDEEMKFTDKFWALLERQSWTLETVMVFDVESAEIQIQLFRKELDERIWNNTLAEYECTDERDRNKVKRELKKELDKILVDLHAVIGLEIRDEYLENAGMDEARNKCEDAKFYGFNAKGYFENAKSKGIFKYISDAQIAYIIG